MKPMNWSKWAYPHGGLYGTPERPATNTLGRSAEIGGAGIQDTAACRRMRAGGKEVFPCTHRVRLQGAFALQYGEDTPMTGTFEHYVNLNDLAKWESD